MGVLVSSDTKNGQLVNVITRAVGEAEITAYQKLLDTDCPKCTACGEALIPKPEDMHLIVYNPLQNMFGMELGRPTTMCQKCGATIEPVIDLDLNAFPSTIAFLQSLRAEYKKRAAAAMAARGVTTIKKGPRK